MDPSTVAPASLPFSASPWCSLEAPPHQWEGLVVGISCHIYVSFWLFWAAVMLLSAFLNALSLVSKRLSICRSRPASASSSGESRRERISLSIGTHMCCWTPPRHPLPCMASGWRGDLYSTSSLPTAMQQH